jgi:DNA-directed RNA polymerase I and III subunit RPAC1
MSFIRSYKVTHAGHVKQYGSDPLEAASSFVDFVKDEVTVAVPSLDEETVVFDIVGIDASIANALRRVMLAEVPTMAIEHVFIEQNTSVLQDEVLAHRLGLVPLKVDLDKFDWMRLQTLESGEEGDELVDGTNTIGFALSVSFPLEECQGQDPMLARKEVYSKDLICGTHAVQEGSEEEVDPESVPRPVDDDILLAVLAPGQSIELEAYARLGIGRDHAKFSPVCTAAYRLHPHVEVNESVVNSPEKGRQLKAMCPMGVFDIEDLGSTVKVVNERNCSLCLECVRREGWENAVRLERVADHYIFSVESTGVMSPAMIVVRALEVLQEKCREHRLRLEKKEEEEEERENGMNEEEEEEG